MTIGRRTILIGMGASLAVAGCLGDDEPGPGADVDSDDDGQDDDEIDIWVSDHDEYGEILVGPGDMTLYMFVSDDQGSEASACYDPCAAQWPPLIVTEPIVGGEGIEADLTSFERQDGEIQGAADGWPLYFFADDEDPGDAKGQGVNDAWWVLEPNGHPINELPETDGNESTDDENAE